MERLGKQIQFIIEVDKLKNVLRQSWLTDKSRRENSAEHSWHLTVMTLVLAEHANEPVDVLRVLKMLIIHDIVEVDAGDTMAYDTVGNADKEERERAAAERLFGLLPPDQTAEIQALWAEFEAGETPEARFAVAMDRFQPMLHNYQTQGKSWQHNNITSDRVLTRNRNVADGSETLWSIRRK